MFLCFPSIKGKHETLLDILPETLSTVPGVQEKLNKYPTLCSPIGYVVH